MRSRPTDPSRPNASTLICTLLLGISPVAAQAEDPVLYETATVRARPVAGATTSVTVLSREEIEALGVSTAAELMRFIPGLDVVSNGPRGGLAWVQVRGGEPNFTAVLVDGVPLNDPTDQLGGVVNLNGLSTMQIERVEVVRGPLAYFHGASGLSGAVNVITRRGRRSAPSAGFEIAAGDASLLQGGVSYGGGNEQRSFHVGASWEQERERIADDRFEQLALVGSLDLGPAERPTLRFSGRAASWEGTDYASGSGGPLFGDGATRSSEQDEISLGLDWTAGSDERPHRVRLAYNHHTLDRISPRVDPLEPSGQFFPRTTEATKFNNFEAGWSYTATSAGERRLDLGVVVEHETGDNRSVLVITEDPDPFAIDGRYARDRTTSSAFADLTDRRGNLDLDFGMRVDVPEEVATQLSPRLGLGYRLANGTTRLRFSASRAYKLPSFFALASPPELGGNPNLEPEIAWGAEFAVEQRQASGRFGGSLGVHFYRYEDLIDFDFATFMNVNRDAAESKGAELTLRWRASDSVVLQSTLGHQRVEILNSSTELRHRPEWVGSVRLSWDATERLRLGLDGQTVSSRFDQQIPVDDRFVVDGYEIFGASASFDVRSGWQLHARVDNLLDTDHETFIGFPGIGRAFRAGVRYRSR